MTHHTRHDVREREVRVEGESLTLPGTLAIPDGASAVVVFCHGSGSSRHSTRNRLVAERLRERGLATLLVDLLSEAEAADRRTVFDVSMLADRVRAGVEWGRRTGWPREFRVGLFGASTGAAAALVAEARGAGAHAIVSRGGRPDLAGDALGVVRCPTLLIIGGADDACIPLNEDSHRRLQCEKRIAYVPGAGHLFEQPGALDRVAELAGDWFARWLTDDRAERAADVH